MPIIYLSGQFVEHQEAALDPLDRGMLLGDGIFETIRCEEGQLLFHVAHFARLMRSARITHLPFNMPNEDLLEICQQILDANSLTYARLRITVTRGESGGGPDFTSGKTAPTLLVHAVDFDAARFDTMRKKGISAEVIDFPLNHRSPLAQVKTTSYQERLLARHRATSSGADEGIFLNTDGILAEGAFSNVFLVKDGVVKTPPVADGALPGIVRLKTGLLCPRLELDYKEESLTLDDLLSADEAFMTNSLMEIMPLTEVNSQLVGNGDPGETTLRLFGEHRKDVESFLESMRTG